MVFAYCGRCYHPHFAALQKVFAALGPGPDQKAELFFRMAVKHSFESVSRGINDIHVRFQYAFYIRNGIVYYCNHIT